MDEQLNYTPDVIPEIRKHFNDADTDKDGLVPVKELKGILNKFGNNVSDSDFQLMLKELELDLNGSAKFEEFLYMLSRPMIQKDAEEELVEAFKIFDKDGDGKIPVSELGAIMKNIGEPLSPEELDEFIKQADSNKDGSIDFAQFVHLMLSS